MLKRQSFQTISLIFSTFSSVFDVEGRPGRVVFHFLPTFHEPFVPVKNPHA
jgi:hypothetical protein